MIPALTLWTALLAAPTTVLVVQSSPADEVGTARRESLERAVEEVARGYFNVRLLLEPEASEAAGSGVGATLARCRLEPSCVRGALATSGLRRALLLNEDHSLPEAVLSVSLFDVEAGLIASSLMGSEPRRVAEGLREVLRQGGARPGGRVAVEIATPGAQVWIDDEPVSQAVVPLSAGKHILRATAEGHAALLRQLSVEVGRETTERVELEPEGAWYEAPVFWGAAGTVVVGTILTVVIVAANASTTYCYGADATRCR